MNEQLQILLNTVCRAAGAAGEIATDTASTLKKRAGELISAARLRSRAAALRRETDAALRQVGEMIYATHTGHPTDSDTLLSKLQEIDALRQEIAQTEELLSRQPERVCPACGTAARSGDVFCRACGEKL